jgi:hypothetical protein
MEHIIAHLKNWKMLSHRYRAPLDKLPEAIKAVQALHFFRYSFVTGQVRGRGLS